jgi:hypothetical protein
MCRGWGCPCGHPMPTLLVHPMPALQTNSKTDTLLTHRSGVAAAVMAVWVLPGMQFMPGSLSSHLPQVWV